MFHYRHNQMQNSKMNADLYCLYAIWDLTLAKPRDPSEAPAPATYNTLHQIDRVLGVLATPGQDGGSEQQDDVAERCRRIDEARAAKDFEAADRLRQELIDAGYDVKTTRDGTTANRKLA